MKSPAVNKSTRNRARRCPTEKSKYAWAALVSHANKLRPEISSLVIGRLVNRRTWRDLVKLYNAQIERQNSDKAETDAPLYTEQPVEPKPAILPTVQLSGLQAIFRAAIGELEKWMDSAGDIPKTKPRKTETEFHLKP